jgi:hypothetical protein
VEPMVAPVAAFAAHTPVQGAPAPEFGIAVVAEELMVVFTKFAPLLLEPELNKLITLALGARRFNCRSPSNDSVALKLTAMFVMVAPAGIPLTVNGVLTPVGLNGMENESVPDDAVVDPGTIPPEAISICAGPVGQALATDGVIAIAVGVLATFTLTVLVLVHTPLLKV